MLISFLLLNGIIKCDVHVLFHRLCLFKNVMDGCDDERRKKSWAADDSSLVNFLMIDVVTREFHRLKHTRSCLPFYLDSYANTCEGHFYTFF